MSHETYKNILKLFSLVVVAIGVYQTYRFQVSELKAIQQQNNSTNSSTSTPEAYSNSSYQSGITIFATTQADEFVRQSLTRRGLTPVIKSYTLEGVEWVFNMILTYGHFAVAMYIYSNFKNPQHSQSKKIKIVLIGIVVIFGWLYLSPRIGYEKIKIVNSSGDVIYHSEKADQKTRFEIFLNENNNIQLFTLLKNEESTKDVKTEQGLSQNNVISDSQEPVEIVSDEDEVKLPQIDANL